VPEDDSIRIETCCPSTIINIIKVLLCLTDTSLYIYICVKHFGMANIKKVFIYSTNVTNSINIHKISQPLLYKQGSWVIKRKMFADSLSVICFKHYLHYGTWYVCNTSQVLKCTLVIFSVFAAKICTLYTVKLRLCTTRRRVTELRYSCIQKLDNG